MIICRENPAYPGDYLNATYKGWFYQVYGQKYLNSSSIQLRTRPPLQVRGINKTSSVKYLLIRDEKDFNALLAEFNVKVLPWNI